jgi:hypothetical protein
MASDQARLDPTSVSERHGQQKDAQAASVCHRCGNSAGLRAVLEGPDCAYTEPYPSSNRANWQRLLPCFERCQKLEEVDAYKERIDIAIALFDESLQEGCAPPFTHTAAQLFLIIL